MHINHNDILSVLISTLFFILYFFTIKVIKYSIHKNTQLLFFILDLVAIKTISKENVLFKKVQSMLKNIIQIIFTWETAKRRQNNIAFIVVTVKPKQVYVFYLFINYL